MKRLNIFSAILLGLFLLGAAGDHIVGGWQIYGTPAWEDVRFPLIGRNLDTSSGRIDYNYTELGVDFAANSRYASTEQLSFIVQIPHGAETGSNIRPHLHWMQNANNTPNFIIEYRAYELGDTAPAFTVAKWTENAIAYTSGTIQQNTGFPEIDMSGISILSAIVDIKLYRDSGDDSGLFGGADGYGVVLAKEFDVHMQFNKRGSIEETVE